MSRQRTYRCYVCGKKGVHESRNDVGYVHPACAPLDKLTAFARKGAITLGAWGRYLETDEGRELLSRCAEIGPGSVAG